MLGLRGAVFLRLVFIFVGEYHMHAFYCMDVVFGSFLIYADVKTIGADVEDEDPSQHPLVLWLQEHLSFDNAYGS